MRIAVYGVGAMAATALLATSARAAARPNYLRIAVSQKLYVYAQFEGKELRMATTVQGLETAKPVKAERYTRQYVMFAPTDLPKPANRVLGAWSNIKAGFFLFTPPKGMKVPAGAGDWFAGAELYLSRNDARRAVWTYTLRSQVHTGTVPTGAPAIIVPRTARLSLKIESEPKGKDEMGIGLRVTAGKSHVGEITRNGKSTQAQISVWDPGGRVVDSRKKALSDLGFR